MYEKSSTNLVAKFETEMKEGERMILVQKPKLNSFIFFTIKSILLSVLLVIGVILLGIFFSEDKGISIWVWSIIFIVFGMSILKDIRNLLSCRNILYAFSNKRILIRTGLFKTKLETINYNLISEIHVEQNRIHKYFSTGTIKINSGKRELDQEEGELGDKIYDDLKNIKDPQEFVKK